MACKECMERREKMVDAVLEGRILAAAGNAVTGAAEMVGLKPKGSTKTKADAKKADTTT